MESKIDNYKQIRAKIQARLYDFANDLWSISDMGIGPDTNIEEYKKIQSEKEEKILSEMTEFVLRSGFTPAEMALIYRAVVKPYDEALMDNIQEDRQIYQNIMDKIDYRFRVKDKL